MLHSEVWRVLITVCCIFSIVAVIGYNAQRIGDFTARILLKLKRTPTSYKGYKVGDRVKVSNHFYEEFVARISRFVIYDKEIEGIHFSNGHKYYIRQVVLRDAPASKEHLPEWF